MKSNKHILLLSPGFPSDEADDSCIPLLQDYLLTFKANHPEIKFSVVTFEYPFKSSAYHWNGIKVYPCNGRNRKLPLKLWTWEKATKVISEIHKNNPIDLLHSFWLDQCALIGSRISKKTGIPHINSLMGQDAKKTNNYMSLLPLQKLFIVAQSEFQAEYFQKSVSRVVDRVIPVGLKDDLINKNSTEERPIDVLGVGSLIQLKDYSMFLRVIHKIKQIHPAVKAVIIGEGKERKALEEIIKSLKLVENVELKGKMSRKEVLINMSKANVFLHCSNYESVGYVFLEAQKAGCKIVSKPVGVAKNSEYWKTSFNESEIVDYVDEFLKQPKAVNWKEDALTMKDTVNDYIKLYLEKSK